MSDNDQMQTLLNELVTSTNATLASHKVALNRHEVDVLAAFRTVKSHAAAIETLRSDLVSLGDLVNKQTEILNCLQESTRRILAVLAMSEPEAPPPSQPN